MPTMKFVIQVGYFLSLSEGSEIGTISLRIEISSLSVDIDTVTVSAKPYIEAGMLFITS